MQNKKIPVYILTGFLGSGKTTVLLRFLEACKEKNIQPGVVLNELGEVNVERGLFQDHQVLELLNGCICCTIKEDLTRELQQYITQIEDINQRPDLIIIEGTGVANPLDIVEALTHPSLIASIEVQSIISLVDASKFLEYQSIFSSSKEIRTILKDQMSHSSLIVLNKVDLLDESKLTKVRKKLKAMTHDQLEVIETSYGEVDVEELLRSRTASITISMGQDEQLQSDNLSHEQHHHGHAHQLFQTLKLDRLRSLDRIKLDRWFKSLPINVLRAKGIIQFTESPGTFQFQYSSNQFSFNRVKENDIDPCIIIIGYDLPVKQIKDSFNESFNISGN
jgi:G3E family GTPase